MKCCNNLCAHDPLESFEWCCGIMQWTVFWYAGKLSLYYPADWLHFMKATHAKPAGRWWVWAGVDWEGGRIFSFMTRMKQSCVWMGIHIDTVVLIIFQVSNVCYFAMDYAVHQKRYAHGLHILWILLCLNADWFFPYHSLLFHWHQGNYTIKRP